MDERYEIHMDNRIGRIAGFAAFALMLVRLSRLVESGNAAPAWHLIMVASAFLGGVIWWLLAQTVANRKLGVILFVIGGIILFLRIAVPDTLLLEFIPTPETFETLGAEMARSIDLIRFGVAPILPPAGVVAILAGLMWITGGLFVWGATDGPASAMILPSLALYMQFAVMDRIPAGTGWMIASAVVISISAIAIAMERRTEAGRIRNLEGRPIPRQGKATAFVLAGVVAVGAVATAGSAASLVPEAGNLRWRLGSGYGPGGGGVSFDRLSDLQQRVISRSDAILFTAVLDEDAPPADEIYWRMETLDTFDGTSWRSSGGVTSFDDQSAGGDPAHAYQGTTQDIAAVVQIDQLSMEVVPTPGIVEEVSSEAFNLSVLQVAGDGSLIYRPVLNNGDRYEIGRASLALHDADLAAMATTPQGELSTMFANAASAGVLDMQPDPRSIEVTRPADLDSFLELPEDLPLGIQAEALLQTRAATTDFERAWLLEYWFHQGGGFEYSIDVSTGHASLDLEAWLTDPNSINYRVGYCEQFSAAMAVMGRSLNIPSRVVWGFTPGDTETLVDTEGNEIEVVVVRDRNAHSWVEMWIDGFGWVQFDPTPRGGGFLPESPTTAFVPTDFLPVPETPSPNANELEQPQPPQLVEEAEIGGTTPLIEAFPWQWLLILPVIALVVGLVPWLKAMRRRRRLNRIREGDITGAWDEIVDRLSDLGQPIPAHETPMEFARRTDDSLVSLATTYSAAVYGDRNGRATEADLDVVEDWLRRRYESGQRFRAKFNPRSLFKPD